MAPAQAPPARLSQDVPPKTQANGHTAQRDGPCSHCTSRQRRHWHGDTKNTLQMLFSESFPTFPTRDTSNRRCSLPQLDAATLCQDSISRLSGRATHLRIIPAVFSERSGIRAWYLPKPVRSLSHGISERANPSPASATSILCFGVCDSAWSQDHQGSGEPTAPGGHPHTHLAVHP